MNVFWGSLLPASQFPRTSRYSSPQRQVKRRSTIEFHTFPKVCLSFFHPAWHPHCSEGAMKQIVGTAPSSPPGSQLRPIADPYPGTTTLDIQSIVDAAARHCSPLACQMRLSAIKAWRAMLSGRNSKETANALWQAEMQ